VWRPQVETAVQPVLNTARRDMCREVVAKAEEAMKSSKAQDAVASVVEQLCDPMPALYCSLCHMLADNHEVLGAGY